MEKRQLDTCTSRKHWKIVLPILDLTGCCSSAVHSRHLLSYLFHLSSTHTLLITSLKTQTIDNLLHTLFSSNFSFVLFVFSLLAFSVSRHPCPIWPKLTQSTTPFPLTNLLCPPPTFVLFSTIFFSSSPPSSCPITLLAHSFTFIYSVFPSLTSEMSFIPRTRCCKEGHLSRKHFNLEMEF